MADQIVSWGGFNSKGTDGMGVTGSFQVSSSANSYFVGGGNVGIGTPTPSASLHISGSSNSALLEIDSPAANNILFVSGSGRVGLGTNNPAYNLDLKNFGTTYFGVKAISLTDAWVGIGTTAYDYVKGLFLGNDYNIHFGGSTLNSLGTDGGDIFGIKISGYQRAIVNGTGAKINVQGYPSPSIIFSTQPTFDGTNNSLVDRMIIDNNGNVVIGTTSPSARLHVRGSGTTDSTTALLIQNANASGSMVVLDNGNVGIGTATPLERLEVAGNIRTSRLSEIYSVGATPTRKNYRLYTNATSDIGVLDLERTGVVNVHLSADFVGNGHSYISGEAGNLGIGTTAPSARLQVKGSGTTSATTALLVENANASGSMVVLDDGNVGIGTAAPTEKLTVNGNTIVGLAAQLGTENAKLKVKAGYEGGAMNGALIEANGATSTLILRHTGNASNSILIDNTNAGTAAMGAGIRINASNNITNFVNFSNSGSTKFLIGGTGDIYVSGSLGIGITSPTSLLQVKGSGTTSATTAFRVENANASGSMVVLDNGFVGIGTSTPSASLHVSGSSNSVLLEIDSPAVNNILYVSGSGNVGIGTSNPIRTLEVNGTLSATQYFTTGSSPGNHYLELISTTSTNGYVNFRRTGGGNGVTAYYLQNGAGYFSSNIGTGETALYAGPGGYYLNFYSNGSAAMALSTSGNLLIGTTSDSARLQVKGSGTTTSTTALLVQNANASASFTVRDGFTDYSFGANRFQAIVGNWTESPAYTNTIWRTGSLATVKDITIGSDGVLNGSSSRLNFLNYYNNGGQGPVTNFSGYIRTSISQYQPGGTGQASGRGTLVLGVYDTDYDTNTLNSFDVVSVGKYATTISGSLTVSGSVLNQPLTLPTASGTASMDCSKSNFFNLTLSGSYTLFLSASNIQPGQTVNLRVTQPATSGSLNYGSQFKFAGGIPYSASATGSAVDIISFISFDTTTLYGSAIKNLS
jgi:hypothetical protein